MEFLATQEKKVSSASMMATAEVVLVVGSYISYYEDFQYFLAFDIHIKVISKLKTK